MARIVKFYAKDIGGGDEDFSITVGFARGQIDKDTDDGLILQRAKEDDPDDQGIYAEVPIQRYASYGGIKEATLSRTQFVITFTPETVRDISGMQISFTISIDQFEKIAGLLKRIFRGHDGLKIEEH